ncbi:MAG: DUF4832 domain-containing protein, partial [Clostridia bacterium]|nr:DUF4832 domain-containing protein [Clostridia bacterium]
DEDIASLYDAYIEAFPNTRLICQIGRPELIEYVSKKSAFGWRGDGLGEPNHLNNIYPPRIEKVKDLWKIAPVSFETYWWPGEWKRKGWDIDNIIEKTLSWHISSLNPKSFPFPVEWKEKVDAWVSKMGYHFYLKACEYEETAAKGDVFCIRLKIENTGVAPIYKKLPVTLRLSGEKNAFDIKTDIDITKWMPGNNEEEIYITPPAEAECGIYTLSVTIPSIVTEYIAFASDAENENGYYKICEIEVK